MRWRRRSSAVPECKRDVAVAAQDIWKAGIAEQRFLVLVFDDVQASQPSVDVESSYSKSMVVEEQHGSVLVVAVVVGSIGNELVVVVEPIRPRREPYAMIDGAINFVRVPALWMTVVFRLDVSTVQAAG